MRKLVSTIAPFAAIAILAITQPFWDIPQLPLNDVPQRGSRSGHTFILVPSHQQLDEVDPQKNATIGRYALPGCEKPHGLALDAGERFAYISCTENPAVIVFDLQSHRVIAKQWRKGGPQALRDGTALQVSAPR